MTKYIQIVYFRLQKYQKLILAVTSLCATIMGGYGYYLSYHSSFFHTLFYAVSQFALQTDFDLLRQYEGNQVQSVEYYLLLSAAVFSMVTVTLGIGLLFLENVMVAIRNWFIKRGNHVVVIGLGRNVLPYIDSELSEGNANIIIVDINDNHSLFHHYVSQGVGFVFGDGSAKNVLKSLRIWKCSTIVISAKSDEKNIEIALEVADMLKLYKDRNIRMVVCLSSEGKKRYYINNGMLDINNDMLDISAYCFEAEAVRDMLQTYDIDGNDLSVIQSKDDFALLLIGSGAIALEALYQSIYISSLPNCNKYKIICISDSADFQDRALSFLGNLKDVRHVEVEFYTDYQYQTLHNQALFHNDIIKNIIVCFDNQYRNISIATDLVERVYRCSSKVPTIINAIYTMENIAQKINENQRMHSNVYTFALYSHICTKQHLINEENTLKAKIINLGYANIFKNDFSALLNNMPEYDSAWFSFNCKVSDKLSNIAQADHMVIKLKAMGLKHRKSSFNTESLLKHNIEMFESWMLRDGIDPQKLYSLLTSLSLAIDANIASGMQNYSEQLLLLMKDTDMYKVVMSEHVRWNNYHFLNDWTYCDSVDKEKKMHNCLVDNITLKTALRHKIIYDVYSIVYIPLYLSKSGYEVFYRTHLKIGVTGHRFIKINENLIQAVKDELQNLSHKAESFKLYTSIAEGADMLVTDEAIRLLNPALHIVLPYEAEKYRESISSDIAQKKFDEYLSVADVVTVAGKLQVDDKEKLYMDAGRCVVDECDVLIALYDGEPSRGAGGTGDVVAYAMSQNKQVIVVYTVRNEGFINKCS